METIVLLKVAKIWATPDPTFLLPLALMIFGRSASPESSESDVLAPSPPGAPSLFGPLGFAALGALGSAAAAGVAGGVVATGAVVPPGPPVPASRALSPPPLVATVTPVSP